MYNTYAVNEIILPWSMVFTNTGFLTEIYSFETSPGKKYLL